jgi:hypothetical protein
MLLLHQEGLVGNQCFCLLHLYNTPLHIIFAGSEMEKLLALFINIIFECGEIPEIFKMGLLSPVYKKKKEQNSKHQIIEV